MVKLLMLHKRKFCSRTKGQKNNKRTKTERIKRKAEMKRKEKKSIRKDGQLDFITKRKF